LNDTAKLQIKSEKIASFGEIFQIKEYRYDYRGQSFSHSSMKLQKFLNLTGRSYSMTNHQSKNDPKTNLFQTCLNFAMTRVGRMKFNQQFDFCTMRYHVKGQFPQKKHKKEL